MWWVLLRRWFNWLFPVTAIHTCCVWSHHDRIASILDNYRRLRMWYWQTLIMVLLVIELKLIHRLNDCIITKENCNRPNEAWLKINRNTATISFKTRSSLNRQNQEKILSLIFNIMPMNTIQINSLMCKLKKNISFPVINLRHNCFFYFEF